MYTVSMLNDKNERRLELEQEVEDCKLSLEEDEETIAKFSRYIDRDKARLVEAMQALNNFKRENAS